MSARLYIPLYTANGGPPLGFRCNVQMFSAYAEATQRHEHPKCGRVLRTERGMLTHLLSVHKIKRQEGLF